MGTNHAKLAAAVGLAAAPAVGVHDWSVVPFTLITAGYGLAPDLDHPGSAAARVGGVLTAGASRAIRSASARLYAATAGPGDESWSGKHRHLSHTLVAAVVLGAVAGGACLLTPWAVVPIYLFGLVLAADRLHPRLLPLGLLAGALVIPTVIAQPEQMGWQIGVAVALGCAAHDVGDALTVSGCPLMWLPPPLSRLTTSRGETWFEIRLLGPFSFHTGQAVEQRLVSPLLSVLLVIAAVPALAPHLPPEPRVAAQAVFAATGAALALLLGLAAATSAVQAALRNGRSHG